MAEESPTVFIIDDDPSARRGMSRLIRASGISVEAYASALDFLNQAHYDRHGCIVLDVKMPGLDGLDLQAEVIKADNSLPIIFVSGHSDVPIAAVAMKKGAVDFLTKPVDRDHLLKAIADSLEKDRENRKAFALQAQVRSRFATLSPREYEVLTFIIAGCEFTPGEDDIPPRKKYHRIFLDNDSGTYKATLRRSLLEEEEPYPYKGVSALLVNNAVDIYRPRVSDDGASVMARDFESKRRPPSCSLPPWQSMQWAARIG